MSISSITNETSLEKVCELYNLPSRVRAGGGVTSSVEIASIGVAGLYL
jgi:hypothetical protein